MRGKDLSEFETRISNTMKHTLKNYSWEIGLACGPIKKVSNIRQPVKIEKQDQEMEH